MALEWQKRCKRADTDVAERRQWWTRCKNYYIEESNILYGRKRKRNGESAGYPIVYRVMAKRIAKRFDFKRDESFDIVASYTTKRTAIKALEYYAEHGKLPPKQPTKSKRRQKAKRQQKASAKGKPHD